MKLLLFVLLVLICELNAYRMFHKGRSAGGNLQAPKACRESMTVKTLWFPQNLDHSNPNDNRTWPQRYYVNDEFYKEGGPAFLMLGGEGAASIKWMSAGAWSTYAKKFGALLFQLEHRYYGESHPTKDISIKNLRYLTSEQALADAAEFITAMQDTYKLKSSTKWIAFGGSYSGSLAAWLRYKYPHLVYGAVSASGPLLAQIDFQDYFRVVDESLATYSDECVKTVKVANDQVNMLIKEKIGQEKLNKDFKLCEPLQQLASDKKHISNFIATLADNFAGVVQYNKDNRITPTAAGNITIDDVCGIMVNQKLGTPVERLAAVNALLLEANDEACTDYNYNTMVKELAEPSWNSNGARQWTYQTCTEFGFYQSSSYQPQVFGDQFPVEFYIQQCQDIFGSRYNKKFLNQAVERTNTVYGALDISVTNVVFVHGSIDPWHALGITKTVDQGAPAIYINGTAHCADMYTPRDSDLPGLKAARVEIANHIDSWLRL